jgi:protein-S-isoprenylcysteine O-methyltransferase Ste14
MPRTSPEPDTTASPAEVVCTQPSRAVRGLATLADHLSTDLLGGPKHLKVAWVINLQKGGTGVFVLLLMAAYGNSTTEAWIYLALHGSYGICWLLKDRVFPDRGWHRRVTYGGALAAFLLVLGPYWLLPYLLISDVLGQARTPADAPLLAAAVALHTIGLAIMIAADAQKYFTLKYRPGLIDEGMFARVRHPNYLGEMMLYGSYALLVGHWAAWAIILWVWGSVFYVNMRMKEASLSRHPGWPAYMRRTGMLLPRLLRRGH